MRNDNTLVFLGLGGLAWFLFDRSKHQRSIAGVRVQITGVQMISGKLEISFNIQNPESKETVIRSLFGEVYINGQKVGIVQNTTAVTIKANANTSYTATVQLKLLKAAVALADLTTGIANSTLIFKGTVNQDNIARPVFIEYKL